MTENPRSLLARSGPPWDVIHVESWGPSIPGLAGLAVEALDLYLPLDWEEEDA